MQLKDRLYTTQLALFVGINLFLLSIGVRGGELTFNVAKIWKNLSSINLQEVILIFLLSILGVAFNGIVPSERKFILVFWKFKNPKPSSEAFTKWMFKDERIDTEALRDKYKNLSTSKEQDVLWYKIYRKHQDKPSVIDAHRSFLLMRDLATISFIFMFLFALYILIKVNFSCLSFVIFLIFLGEYVFLSISARNYGIRLVCNVLAEESLEIKDQILEKEKGSQNVSSG